MFAIGNLGNVEVGAFVESDAELALTPVWYKCPFGWPVANETRGFHRSERALGLIESHCRLGGRGWGEMAREVRGERGRRFLIQQRNASTESDQRGC